MKKILASLPNVNLISLLRLDKFQKQMIYIVSIAVVVLLNSVMSTVPFRLDLSQGKAYTLSQPTKKILQDLDDVVNIKFYVSSDLPTSVMPLRTDVEYLLTEYKRANDKVQLSIEDPKRSEEAQSDANEAGLREIQFSQMEQDQFAVNTAYFGIVIYHGGEKEVLPQVVEIGDLEYNITSAIYKLSRAEVPRIGFMGSPQDFMNPQGDTLGLMREVLSKQYDVEDVQISSESASIDQELKTLLVFDQNPKIYSEEEQTAIKTYLNNKGKGIFFVDGVWVTDQGMLNATESGSNLPSIVSEYGIEVDKNLILSESAEIVSFGGGQGGFQSVQMYPFWMNTNNFDADSSLFSNINQLVYPWASSLTMKEKKGYTVEGLVKTKGRSWEQSGSYVLMPNDIPQPSEDSFKEYTLTAISRSEEEDGTEVLVVPTSRFIQTQFVQQAPTNLGFILNAVNEFASDGALTGIRQRAVNFYPLPKLPPAQQDIFKYGNILLLPALFAIYGVVRLTRRK